MADPLIRRALNTSPDCPDETSDPRKPSETNKFPRPHVNGLGKESTGGDS